MRRRLFTPREAAWVALAVFALPNLLRIVLNHLL